MKRDELVAYLDEYLRVKTIQDDSQNGLQVDGPEEILKVAFAVDACQAAFDQAIAAGAQLLIVHHGLFWEKPIRLIGHLFKRVRTLITGGCALYAAHLPLDIHPEVGNNAELARLLGLQCAAPFGEYHGSDIGIGGFDTFITGETSHSHFHLTTEYGLNVVFGGHYATETPGVKALARHLSAKFGLETVFLDIPTGL